MDIVRQVAKCFGNGEFKRFLGKTRKQHLMYMLRVNHKWNIKLFGKGASQKVHGIIYLI